jgi:hypothetical protein
MLAIGKGGNGAASRTNWKMDSSDEADAADTAFFGNGFGPGSIRGTRAIRFIGVPLAIDAGACEPPWRAGCIGTIYLVNEPIQVAMRAAQLK